MKNKNSTRNYSRIKSERTKQRPYCTNNSKSKTSISNLKRYQKNDISSIEYNNGMNLNSITNSSIFIKLQKLLDDKKSIKNISVDKNNCSKTSEKEIINDQKNEKEKSNKQLLKKELLNTQNITTNIQNTIYKIQKNNLSKFKNEIIKYQKLYDDLENQSKSLSLYLQSKNKNKESLVHKLKKISEDLKGDESELNKIENDILTKINDLKNMEKNQPNEFNYLKEDIKNENILKELLLNLDNNEIKINLLKTEKNEKENNLSNLINKINELKDEKKEYEKKINDINNSKISQIDDYFNNSESNQLTIYENLKNIFCVCFQYINSKTFNDNDNNIEKFNELLKELEKNKSNINKKLNEYKNDKINMTKSYEEQLNNNKKNINNADIKIEMDSLLEVVSKINEDSKLITELYEKYIFLIKDTKSSKIIINTMKNDLVTLINANNNLNNNSCEVEKYLDEFFSQQEEIGYLSYNIKNIENDLKNYNNELKELNESLEEINKSLLKLNNENLEINNKISDGKKIIENNEKINQKNLNELNEIKFNNLMDETRLKEMQKIYGNRLSEKIYMKKKEEFLNDKSLEFKNNKNLIEGNLSFFQNYKNLKEKLSNSINNKKDIQKEYQTEYNALETELIKKETELEIINKTKNELQIKIQKALDYQTCLLQEEKQKLYDKYNYDFYIKKINILKKKLNINDVEDDNIELNKKNNNIKINKFKSFDKKKSNKSTKKEINNIINVDEYIDDALLKFNKSNKIIQNGVETNKIKNISENIINKKEPNNAYYNFITSTGIKLYKKISNKISTKNKNFDINKIKDSPQNYGFVLREFKINLTSKCINIYKTCLVQNSFVSNHPVEKIFFIDIIDIYFDKKIKNEKLVKDIIIHYNKNNKKDKFIINNSDILSKEVFELKYYLFHLITTKDTIELIAPNLYVYVNFVNIIKNIITNKKNNDNVIS